MTLRPPLSSARLAPLLGGLAMFGAFSIDTIFPAFPDIGAEYGVGKVAMQQTVSLYLLAYAAMSLVHGPLSDAIGRRRVIVGGLLVFIGAQNVINRKNLASYSWDRRANTIQENEQIGLFPLIGMEWRF